jgi:hypothetical protein
VSETQRRLVYRLFDATKERFPEITTDFEIWLNPDNNEHLLVNVHVPFYDNDRELEFSAYTAKLECESHEQSGVHISLIPQYVPELESA